MDHEGIGRPQVFGAGISVGMLAGMVIGSLVTMWIGEAVLDLAHRWIARVGGSRRERVNFELLLQ